MLTVAVAAAGTVASGWLVAVARRAATVHRARRLATRPRRLPRRLRAPLVRALHDAAYDLAPEDAAQWWAAAVAGCAIAGWILAPAAGLAGAGAALVGVPLLVRSQRGRRRRLVAVALPDAIDDVAAELRAGGTIFTAMERLARGDGVLAADFARVLQRTDLGAPLVAAVEHWARDAGVDGTVAFAGALSLSAAVGGRSAAALEGMATSLRERQAVVAEAHALSAQARYSGLVMMLAPLVSVGWAAVTGGTTVPTLLGTNAGRACLVIGLALEVLGASWMRVILRPVHTP